MNHKKMWIFVLIGIVLAVLVLFWVWMRQSAGEELVLDEMSTEQISTADVEGELVPEELGKTNIGKTTSVSISFIPSTSLPKNKKQLKPLQRFFPTRRNTQASKILQRSKKPSTNCPNPIPFW